MFLAGSSSFFIFNNANLLLSKTQKGYNLRMNFLKNGYGIKLLFQYIFSFLLIEAIGVKIRGEKGADVFCIIYGLEEG
jgi:hypothetical protein